VAGRGIDKSFTRSTAYHSEITDLSGIDTIVQLSDGRKESKPTGLQKVDYHCHTSITEYTDPAHPTIISVSVDEFLADLDEARIDRAIVLSDARTSPEKVASFVKQASDRLLGFGYINPVLRGAAKELRRQREDLGLFGLKLYPCTDGYSPDDPNAYEAYEVAQELDIPVLIHHAGMPEAHDLLYHTDPAQIDVMAHNFPKLRIILAHLGYPRVDETLYVLRKHKNVYADISWPYGNINHASYLWLLWRDLLTALNMGVIQKLIFGTDYPGIRQKPYLDMLMSVNRYSPHRDLQIPAERLWAMLDENVQPLLP
jgi:predicted TIM-barrel fold metal-dependent hydrolase